MNAESIAPVIKACLAQMQTKLEDARQIARAAEACAEAGRLDQAVEVSMDVEQLIYDADRLHDAVALLGRMVAADR